MKKTGEIAKRKDALERVENDLRSEIDSPISNKSIAQKLKTVNEAFEYGIQIIQSLYKKCQKR